MAKHEVMIVANYSQTSLFTFDELCTVCHLSSEALNELISYEIIHPKYTPQNEHLFDMKDLQRIKTTVRLQHDLEVNLAGVALILNLLDEIEDLRARNAFLQRYF